MDISTIISVLSSGLASLAVVFFITRFLQKGQIESSLTRKEIELIKAELREGKNYETGRPPKIYSLVNSLKEELEEVRAEFSHLNEEEKSKIIEGLKNSLKSTAAEEVLKELESKITKNVENKIKLSIMEKHFETTIGRLREELFSLTKRSNLNLALGVVTTLIGLGLLGVFVLSNPVSFKETSDFVESFVPRLSLVIFIEIFAYFFLRLYKDTLSEIKYFQNEITNIESKYLAVAISISSQSENGIIHSIDSLLSTERNHILNKGQTTVEIEKARTEQQLTDSVLDKLSSVFNKSPNK